jgi:hypothetical protein
VEAPHLPYTRISYATSSAYLARLLYCPSWVPCVPSGSHGSRPRLLGMKAPKCRLCSGLHWNNEPHVFATNTATNTKSATNVATNNATNGSAGVSEGLGCVRPGNAGNVDGQQGAVGGGSPAALKSSNRRAREAYNAYQREYMKAWRLKQKS